MSNEAYDNPEDRHGVYEHICGNIFVDETFEEALIKSGSSDVVDNYKRIQKMFHALSPEVIEDLKNLTLREIKEKYGLDGDKINSEFIVTTLYQKTVKGK